jgi:hypothetical protein
MFIAIVIKSTQSRGSPHQPSRKKRAAGNLIVEKMGDSGVLNIFA